MNLAALLLLGTGLAVGQAPVPANDYQAMKTRSMRLDLAGIDAAEQARIARIELLVSSDMGQTWTVWESVKPDQLFLPFITKEDGAYWVTNMTVFKNGSRDPEDPTKIDRTQIQKLLIDTTSPVLKIRTAQRAGDDITLDWSVDDRNPNDSKTKVEWKPTTAADSAWKAVIVSSADKRSARFNPNANDAIVVRISVEDVAGNVAVQSKEIAGIRTSSIATPPAPELTQPLPNLSPDTGGIVAPQILPQVAPLSFPTTQSAPVIDLTGGTKPMTYTPPPAPMVPIASGAGIVQPMSAAPSLPTMAFEAVKPEPPKAQIVNFLRFELPYQLDAGPSGVSRIDLYLTRDDGKSWSKWSQHDGKESPLRVALDTRVNPQPEGTYGFRLVPISGAGLSESLPIEGSVPDFRVQVDVTPPMIKIFQPEAEPNQRDTLLLKWSVTDKNLAKDSVVLVEWSEGATGPWKVIGGNESIVPVAAGIGSDVSLRIPNTGSYAWKLPANLPSAKVYLKMTAWDAAGNKSEVSTPSPVLVDLVKPRARIQGIMQPTIAKQ